ncbi:MAG: glycosyltransferase family 39 protein, partial [Rikenellaceae bacterium]
YPDWSYFDHPPLVAWLIRLTTFGGEVSLDGVVRLGALLIGTLNTWLIYRITRRLSGGCERSGLISALLYTGSIYCFVISGTFIMPDTPLTLFWLLAFDQFSYLLPLRHITRRDQWRMILAWVYVGLAMLSKYSGAYLGGAAGLYILLFNRTWFSRWSLYVAPVVSLVVFLPVILWNVEYDFITFRFHGARVTSQSSVNWLYFGREIFGGIFYNNPVNWVVSLLSIVVWRRVRYVSAEIYRFILVFSLPMIALFLGISLTRETLPHWASPAYVSLIVLSGCYLSTISRGLFWAKVSAGFVSVIALLGILQINFGLIDLDSREGVSDLGRMDFSLDTYGWAQGGALFAQYVAGDTILGDSGDVTLVNYSWHDLAHLDCYFSLPYGFRTMAMGDISSTHYWEWINRERGGFSVGDSFYLVTTSRYSLDPLEIYGSDFERITSADTLPIYRRGDHVYNFYVYRLIGLRSDSRFFESQISGVMDK